MSKISNLHNGIILDASCAINLYASRRMEEIIRSFNQASAISIYVCRQECTYINDETGTKETIDLQRLIDQGLLDEIDPTPKERIDFQRFTTILGDDGESYTGAIALHRNYAMAIDDGAARKFFSSLSETSHIHQLSTPELLQHWIDIDNPQADTIKRAIYSIERQRYRPSRRHHLYAWWNSLK